MLVYQRNVGKHMKNVKIHIKDLCVIVNMVTNGNMVIVGVRKSQTVTPLYK